MCSKCWHPLQNENSFVVIVVVVVVFQGQFLKLGSKKASGDTTQSNPETLFFTIFCHLHLSYTFLCQSSPRNGDNVSSGKCTRFSLAEY